MLCLAGLVDVYGLRFDEFVALDVGGPLTHQALLDGVVDVALLFTTDPLIGTADIVELTDDRGLQPAENITPLVRVEIVDRWGQALVDVIDAASAELTTSAVRELHDAAAAPDADIGTVVAAWRSESVVVSTESPSLQHRAVDPHQPRSRRACGSTSPAPAIRRPATAAAPARTHRARVDRRCCGARGLAG